MLINHPISGVNLWVYISSRVNRAVYCYFNGETLMAFILIFFFIYSLGRKNEEENFFWLLFVFGFTRSEVLKLQFRCAFSLGRKRITGRVKQICLLCLFTGKDKQNKLFDYLIVSYLEQADYANLVSKTLFHFFTGKKKCYKWNFFQKFKVAFYCCNYAMCHSVLHFPDFAINAEWHTWHDTLF